MRSGRTGLGAIARGLTACAVLGFCAGCPSLKLRVNADPRDATGTVTRIKQGGAKGQEYAFSPRATKLKLNSDDSTRSYVVTAAHEGWQPATKEYTLVDLERLPEDRQGYHVLDFPLTNEYQEQLQLVVVYDAKSRGFVGKTRRVRAWRQTDDDDKGTVSRVFDKLDKDAGIRGMAVSPDGGRLVFAEAIAKDRSAVKPQVNNILELDRCNLMAINIKTATAGDPTSGGLTHLRTGDYTDLDPSFTADGEAIVFASNRRRPRSADLLQMSSRGRAGGIRDIYRVPDNGTTLSPSVGTDGTIAFTIYDPDYARSQVWTVAGGKFPTEIIDGTQPSISPDGLRIAYIGNDRNLWVIDSDGAAPTQLTFAAEELLDAYRETLKGQERKDFDAELFAPYSFPTWTPDGSKIVFTSMDGADATGRPNDDIWVIDADGTNPVSITNNGSIDSTPVVSPDGRRVFFISNRGGPWAIWAIEPGEIVGDAGRSSGWAAGRSSGSVW